VVSEFAYFKQIVSGAGHDLAGPVFVKKRERLAFDVGEHVAAHVRFNVNAEQVTEIGDEPLCAEPQTVEREQQNDDDQERAHRSFRRSGKRRQQCVYNVP